MFDISVPVVLINGDACTHCNGSGIIFVLESIFLSKAPPNFILSSQVSMVHWRVHSWGDLSSYGVLSSVEEDHGSL